MWSTMVYVHAIASTRHDEYRKGIVTVITKVSECDYLFGVATHLFFDFIANFLQCLRSFVGCGV